MPNTAPNLDPRAVANPAASSRISDAESHRLAGDEIGFDAWLLPPEEPDAVERAIRLISTVAGPVTLVGAVIGLWLMVG